MVKVLVLDSARGLQEDLNLQMIVEGYEDEFEVIVADPKQVSDLKTFIDKSSCGFVVVSHDAMEGLDAGAFSGAKVYGYTKSKEKPQAFDDAGIPYMGNAVSASDILRVMYDAADGRVPDMAWNNVQTSQPAAVKDNKPAVKAASAPSVQDLIDADDDVPAVSAQSQESKPAAEPQKPVNQASEPVAEKRPVPQPTIAQERLKNDVAPAPAAEKMTRGAQLRQNQLRKEREEYEAQQYQEENRSKKRTTTVAVFSAKGGVGKTTISSNLAMYLSMMAHGRGTYRVCIVDYNIDFGDVRSTLGYSEDGIDMGTWAEDIHNQLVRGRRPEDIQFTKNQVESYLQRHGDTGLYALLAPLMHEEAMTLEGDALQVMLRNIIENGEFDFVICDTGNNTRDSSYFALDMADVVLLVCTQDATTVTCNGSALNALKRLDFDLTKVRIIINNVVSAKQTGVSAAEVEEAFNEYECIARIHRNEEVLRANNYSQPLVMKPNHPFTQEMRNIVTYLTHEENLAGTPVKKKNKFFGIFG